MTICLSRQFRFRLASGKALTILAYRDRLLRRAFFDACSSTGASLHFYYQPVCVILHSAGIGSFNRVPSGLRLYYLRFEIRNTKRGVAQAVKRMCHPQPRKVVSEARAKFIPRLNC